MKICETPFDPTGVVAPVADGFSSEGRIRNCCRVRTAGCVGATGEPQTPAESLVKSPHCITAQPPWNMLFLSHAARCKITFVKTEAIDRQPSEQGIQLATGRFDAHA